MQIILHGNYLMVLNSQSTVLLRFKYAGAYLLKSSMDIQIYHYCKVETDTIYEIIFNNSDT